jgi:hypothetical protein
MASVEGAALSREERLQQRRARVLARKNRKETNLAALDADNTSEFDGHTQRAAKQEVQRVRGVVDAARSQAVRAVEDIAEESLLRESQRRKLEQEKR